MNIQKPADEGEKSSHQSRGIMTPPDSVDAASAGETDFPAVEGLSPIPTWRVSAAALISGQSV